jgi:hypothetical protein
MGSFGVGLDDLLFSEILLLGEQRLLLARRSHDHQEHGEQHHEREHQYDADE